VTECKKCTESPHCKKLMAAGRKKAEESAGKKGDKVKKVKKAEKPEKVKKHREEDDAEESPKKPTKTQVGEALRKVLGFSNYKQYRGKIQMGGSGGTRLFVLIAGQKRVLATHINSDTPTIRLLGRDKPKALGLDPGEWKGNLYSGPIKGLGKKLAGAFKATRRLQSSESEDEE